MPVLTSPEMTGEWEYKLQQMERGQFERSSFMKEITDLTQKIVESARSFEETETHSKPFDGKSPIDGAGMIETMRYYQTPDGVFRLSKYVAGRMLEPHEAKTLLEKKFLGPLTGFRSRLGRPFVAALKLNAEQKVEFVFEDSAATPGMEAVNFETQQPVGTCPIDGGRVFEGTLSFICEHALKESPTCKFRIGKKILGQEVTKEQVTKLLAEKKTDLLNNFVSQRTKRRFSAYLVLQEAGKVGFEFQPREGKEGGAKSSGKSRFTPKASATPAQTKEQEGTRDSAAAPKKKTPSRPRKSAPAKKRSAKTDSE